MRRFILGWAIAAVACLQPAMAFASDQEIAQRIATSLRASGQLVDYSIGVKYQDGTAWLTGRVASQQQLERAIELTEEVSDVSLVVSHLEVRATAAAAPVAPTYEPVAHQQASNPLTRLATPPMATPPQASGVSPAYYASQENAPAEPRTLAGRQPTQMPASPTSRYGQPTRGMTPLGQRLPQQVQPQQYQQQYPQAMQYARPGQPMQQPQYMAAANYAPANGGVVTGNGMAAGAGVPGAPLPYAAPGAAVGVAPAAYDQPYMPNYAWPAYAAYPNYAGLTYPKQYSPSAWPYIGPFYPYPQVPLGWRKVTLEWDDGWWFLDFDDRSCQ